MREMQCSFYKFAEVWGLPHSTAEPLIRVRHLNTTTKVSPHIGCVPSLEGLVCWSLPVTSLCHSNGHIQKLIPLLPRPGFDPSFSGHNDEQSSQVDKTTPQTAQPSGLAPHQRDIYMLNGKICHKKVSLECRLPQIRGSHKERFYCIPKYESQ